MIQQLAGQYPVDAVCRLLRVPRSTFYYRPRRLDSAELIEALLNLAAQSVHRGGFHLINKLYGDGYVVAGSAGRLLLNNVLTLRGMDVAVASAAAAAQAILQARAKKDYTSNSLAAYETLWKETSVYQDMATFKDMYGLMENKRLFQAYPEIMAAVMQDLFSVRNRPAPKALASLRKHMQGKVSLLDMAKDALQIARGIGI